jgi:hypothetical protein
MPLRGMRRSDALLLSMLGRLPLLAAIDLRVHESSRHVGALLTAVLITSDALAERWESDVERRVKELTGSSCAERELRFETELREALRALRRRTGSPRLLKQWIRDAIVSREDCGATVEEERVRSIDILGHVLDRQAFETGSSRWGGRWLLTYMMARGGEMDIAVRAIGDDLMDAARSIITKSEREELVEDDEQILIMILEDSESVRGEIFRSDVEDVILRRALDQFLESHPKHEDGIRILLSDNPLVSLAAERRVTPSALIYRRNQAQKALVAWWRKQNG